MKHPFFSDTATPRIFAHRGLVTPELHSRGIVENSRLSVVAAVEAGATYVESDCHLTSDGVVVLFHDADLRRVIGDPRLVAAVSFAELSDLMAERGGLLTLEAALNEFAETRFNIDVKADAVAEPAGVLVGAHCERMLLTSFSDDRRRRALAAARQAAAVLDAGPRRPATSPGRSGIIKVLLAAQLGSRRALQRAFAGIDALQIPERHGAIRVLSPRLIDVAHAAGIEVHVWTVNDPSRMHELVGLGVDGIITDRVDVAIAALR